MGESKKRVYSIGEVSVLTGLKPFVLRFWESQFPMLSPERSQAGRRIYRPGDVEMVLQIKNLLYAEGYTIPGARKKLEESSGVQLELSLEDIRGREILQAVHRGLRELREMLNSNYKGNKFPLEK